MSVDDLLIRSALPADAEGIAAFQSDEWREAYKDLLPEKVLDLSLTAVRIDRWRERLSSKVREAAVVLDGVNMVGVASWTSTGREPGIELNTLYIRERWQGTGLAERLLYFSIQNRSAVLWVFEENLRARRFYEKHGFEPDGGRQVDPGTGVWEVRLRRGQ